MKVGVLFSGGKDSTFSIYQSRLEGHRITCLLSIFPQSEESGLFHYPNLKLTELQAESMKIPHRSLRADSNSVESEMMALKKLLTLAKEEFEISGIVQGGILSDFQKKRFENICFSLGLKLLSPVWHKNQTKYMNGLIQSQFKFMIISVTADGLGESWLGKIISPQDLQELEKLAQKKGFNISFEGGEAETFVVDCPLFAFPIKIKNFKKVWDGYRGNFDILEAELDYDSRRN